MMSVGALVVAFLCATGFISYGVFALAGIGWASIALGVAFLIVCGVLVRGLRGVNSGG